MVLKRIIFVLMVSISLAGCGGGGSDAAAVQDSDTPTLNASTNLIDSETQVVVATNFNPVTDTPLNYLNYLRSYVQLPAYVENATLLKSANAHLNYMLHHNALGHAEDPQNSLYFTGKTPQERTHAAGYQWPGVSENISYNKANFTGLIDELMTAVYHRMSLLDFQKDEIGIAYKEAAVPNKDDDPIWSALVTNAGVFALVALCDAGGDGQSGYLCSNNAKISKTRYQSEMDALAKKAADMVVWPAPNSQVLPAFFEETPDPLPDCKVSGNPISVQINPSKLADYTLLPDTFRLIEKVTGAELVLNRVLSNVTDQPDAEAANWKTAEMEWFAAFPQQRLKWQTLYEASFDYVYSGQTWTKTWQFVTPSFDGELIALYQNAQYDYPLGQTLYIYVPPENCAVNANKWASSYQYDAQQTPELSVEAVDPQTLKLVARQVSQMTLTFTQTDLSGQDYIKTLKLNIR
ncbi:MAG: hypothetical protein CO158_02310 [Piscirickettsiaceae bacterium CG_4_9_14_3_um_filter_43_564]|nr:MAG: hypothetical protein COW74_00165 [Piscirickettsiaceae bacterium CG18_big_fil_WC_8_21_14_2_50_44_103]PIW56806.1 MAG: hypothetical protein COW14_09355 [Piscirickettsiaceae bacterium CG12_big_fil_rev_8_21_14_0_65_44_934]PIW77623.1 MAG: hypothetical protein CO000_06085 [Piscirickettsiaceae bacterium CG_4_8_14_3_um_filter_44_38]PIX78653.1 MAG: hypothetical protein COZ36_07700 [Piscirickettsiaceae bacterium CG_4_10_14_3_um_filter_44_349]PJA66626.1 MAG: hypothetical protein CO158_02310 [Piscir